MKPTTPSLIITLAALAFTAGGVRAQQALKTDPAGNPVTTLNLGGDKVTGTLAATHLPVGIGLPVVQSITQAAGNVAVAADANVTVLTAPLTGALNLLLPTAGSRPAGRALIVVDPGGYSSFSRPVNAVPASGDTLNGGTGSFLVVAGTGTGSLYPDAAKGWSAGQSYLRAPTTAGLAVSGPATSSSANLFSVRSTGGVEMFAIRGNGNSVAHNLEVSGTFGSDTGGIYSDGHGKLVAGTFFTGVSVTSPVYNFQAVSGPDEVPTFPDGACLYYGDDGHLHVRTPDGGEHVLSWTTAP